MLLSWKILSSDGITHAWDGEKGTPAVQALFDEWNGHEYIAHMGLVCGPTYTASMILELASDLLFGNDRRVVEWEDDDEPEPGSPGTGGIPEDAVC